MSDIRVSVQWKSSTVFAGEAIECTITFKNVAQARSFRRSPSPNSDLHRHGSSRERWKETLPLRSSKSTASSNYKPSRSVPGLSEPKSKTHRPALSLSTTNGFAPTPRPGPPGSVSRTPTAGNNQHRRSVSIVSIGGDTIDETPSPNPVRSSGRPLGSHVRAASLQVLPRRSHKPGSGSQSGSSECSKHTWVANHSVSIRTRTSFYSAVTPRAIFFVGCGTASRFQAFCRIGYRSDFLNDKEG